MSTATDTTKIVRGACPHDCPDTCAMLITVENGRVVEVRGDPDHPFTRGALCVKVDDYHHRTGCFLHPAYWPAKLARLAAEGVDAARYLSFGDYLLLRLAGEVRTSVSTASGTGLFDPNRLDWDGETLEAVGLDPSRLAPVSDDPVAGVTNVRGLVLLALWDAFKREGIAIPSPIQDVRLVDPVHTADGRAADTSIVPRDQPA